MHGTYTIAVTMFCTVSSQRPISTVYRFVFLSAGGAACFESSEQTRTMLYPRQSVTGAPYDSGKAPRETIDARQLHSHGGLQIFKVQVGTPKSKVGPRALSCTAFGRRHDCSGSTNEEVDTADGDVHKRLLERRSQRRRRLHNANKPDSYQEKASASPDTQTKCNISSSSATTDQSFAPWHLRTATRAEWNTSIFFSFEG